jgi:hypothetical protein
MAEWALWQKILGWVRKALNAAHHTGIIPSKKHGPDLHYINDPDRFKKPRR